MKASRPLLAFVISLLGLTVASAQSGLSRADTRRQAIDANASRTLEELFAQKGNARTLFDKAAGYAVFSATKAGLILTGGRGTGVVIGKAGGKRVYMRMATGGIGIGIGAQQYDLVVLFEDAGQLNRFVEGGWDASTAAQAAAGNDGLTFASSFANGVALFQITDRGLMAQADISGTRFWQIDSLNAGMANAPSVADATP